MQSSSCFILADGLFRPSAARGGLASCFWRHPMAKDTTTALQGQVLPVPKIIWSCLAWEPIYYIALFPFESMWK